MPSGNGQDMLLVSDMPVATNNRFPATHVAAARHKWPVRNVLRPLARALAVSAPVPVVPVG
jgi:hypothetical protein